MERKPDLTLEHLGLEFPEDDLLRDVRGLVALGPSRQIEAIRRYREFTGAGLYDAKTEIDEMARAPRG